MWFLPRVQDILSIEIGLPLLSQNSIQILLWSYDSTGGYATNFP